MSEDSEINSLLIEKTEQSSNQRKHGMLIAGTAIAIIILLYWSHVNFVLQPRYDNFVSVNLLDESGMYVTVSYPVGIPANGSTAKLQYSIDNRLDVTQTVTLTAVLPQETHLLFTNSPLIPSVAISPHTHTSSTMLLVNAVPPKLISQKEFIPLSISATNTISPASSITSTEMLTVSAESIWSGRTRHMVTSTVNNASPLIIFFVSLTLIIRWYVKEQRILDKEKEEKDKEVEEKWLEAQRQKEQEDKKIQKNLLETQRQKQYKQEASEFIGQVRRSIINNQLNKADPILKKLQEPTYKNFEASYLDIAQDLVALARLTCPSDEVVLIVQKCREWADESMVAFMLAWRTNGKQTEPSQQDYINALLQARYWLPMEQANSKLQNQLSNIELKLIAEYGELKEFRLPFKDWPKPPKYPDQDLITTKFFTPERQDHFAHKFAENDLYALFSLKHGFFYGGHPIFNKLFDYSDQPAIVMGTSGSGRTALAYALHYHAIDRGVFAFHLSGISTLGKIQAQFAAHIFDFALQRPTNLRRLTVAQRNLLASLFISNQEKSVVLANIETEQTKIYSSFSTLSQNEEENSISQLRLLAKAVHTAAKMEESDKLRAGALFSTVHSLGFTQCVLSLDISDSKEEIEWVKKTILPDLLRWQAQGLRIILFTSENIKQKLDILHGVYRHNLIWKETQLKRMFRWRYRASITHGKRGVLEQYFQDGMLDYLIEQASNPGYLFNLWHEITESLQANELISKKSIQSALKHLQISESTSTILKYSIDDPHKWDYTKWEVLQILEEKFNWEKLDTLWLKLNGNNIDKPQQINSVRAYAREILLYFERHGQLNKLNKYVYKERNYPSESYLEKNRGEL